MRYIILLFALTLSIAKASAQDVLNEVLRTSDAILNDTTKSMDERRTALFKFDAMTYMRSKILPPYVMLDKNLSKDTLNIKVRYLNEQAYAMSVYITTPRMFLLLSASTAIGFQPWHLSAASTGQSFKKIQIFLSYNRSSKRPTVQTSSLAVDLLRERFSFKNTWFTEVSHVGST